MTDEVRSDRPAFDRRSFLRMTGSGSAAALATLTASQADAATSDPDPDQSEYRETAHVRAYYASARF